MVEPASESVPSARPSTVTATSLSRPPRRRGERSVGEGDDEGAAGRLLEPGVELQRPLAEGEGELHRLGGRPLVEGDGEEGLVGEAEARERRDLADPHPERDRARSRDVAQRPARRRRRPGGWCGLAGIV